MKKKTSVLCGLFAAVALCGAGEPAANANLLLNADLSAPLGTYKAQPGSGWFVSYWIHGSDENRQKFDKSTQKMIVPGIVVTEDGKKALELNRPAELETLMGNLSDKFTVSFSQIVKPDDKGGIYQLSVDYRSEVIGKNRHDQLILLWFRDGRNPRPDAGKETRPYDYLRFDPATNNTWKTAVRKFKVPAGTRDLNVTFRADGAGKIQFRNMKLVRLADLP